VPAPRRLVGGATSVGLAEGGPDWGSVRQVDADVGAALERLRGRCMALPEATERLSHGEPTWFVRGKKVFVTFAGRHHDDRVAFWCAASAEERDALVSEDSDRFFVPPYVGGRGWLGVYLDTARVDWAEIDEIVREAYRLIAPKQLAALLDGPTDTPS
jgi:hypothetical protein